VQRASLHVSRTQLSQRWKETPVASRHRCGSCGRAMRTTGCYRERTEMLRQVARRRRWQHHMRTRRNTIIRQMSPRRSSLWSSLLLLSSKARRPDHWKYNFFACWALPLKQAQWWLYVYTVNFLSHLGLHVVTPCIAYKHFPVLWSLRSIQKLGVVATNVHCDRYSSASGDQW